MKHPFWERAWKPSLDIRLSDHVRCKYEYQRWASTFASCWQVLLQITAALQVFPEKSVHLESLVREQL